MAELHPLRLGAERVTTAETATIRSPFDGTELGRVAIGTSEHVDAAVAAAQVASADPLPAYQRAAILDAAADRLAARHEEFARSIAGEAAKPLKSARVEAARAVGTFRFAAVEARTLAGDMIAMDANDAGIGKFGFTLRIPIGVVGAISPFNFPLNLVSHKVAPAIAAGCPVVLKPASQTPLTALLLAEVLLDECDLPPGWLNVVVGGGGSVGNNAPVIVEPDADLELAAAKIVAGGFGYSGQTCISVQRVYAHDSIRDELVDRVVAQVEQLVVGDPMDDATDVSALINAGERDRIVEWIDEATAGGAKIATGGAVVNDVLIPTVLTGVLADMNVCSQEVFGPLIGFQGYQTLDDAFTAANDSRYGLQAAIFTTDLGAALKAAHALDFGGVIVNEMPTFRTDQMPYGGVKDSGNTKEGPHYAVREMTEERLVVIQM